MFSRLRVCAGAAAKAKKKQKNTCKINFKKHSTVVDFSYFFRAGKPCIKNPLKMTSHSPSGTLRDPPGTLKSINFSPLGGPGAHPIICFALPGRPQEPFGALLAPTLGPHGAQKCPGGLQALIFDPPGTPWGPFFFDFLVILHGFPDVLLRRFICVFVFVLVFAPFFFQTS